MAARKPYVVTAEDREILKLIRQCEHLRIQAHRRRDALIVEARKKGIPLRLVGEAFGAGTSNVHRIVALTDPGRTGLKGKPLPEETDVQESS